MVVVPSVLFVVLLLLVRQQGYVTEAIGRKVHFASPLQSITIWDPEYAEEKQSSHRSQFLPKYEVSLRAEAEVRQKLAEKKRLDLQVAAKNEDGRNWEQQAERIDRQRRQMEERLVTSVTDQAVEKYEQSLLSTATSTNNKSPHPKNPNQYQFVGVIRSRSSSSSSETEEDDDESPIQWYARKKPSNAKWSVRLVHVNREAIITDLFRRGKVDIFARYENTGQTDKKTGLPIIARKCFVKERSWRTLWNFSPKHFFTDSSGMYWRERRLRPGLYTDGNMVYESSYRYRDGRNGMHRLSSFQQYLNSKAVSNEKKKKIVKRLKESSPDIVVED